MTRRRGLEGGTDDMPVYIRAGMSESRDWVRRAPCTTVEGEMKAAWTIAPNERRLGVRGDQWIAGALLICGGCPVQWNCVRYAIRTMASACTWGADIRDVLWLGTQSDWESIVDAAEELHMPVQEAIRRVRAARAGGEAPVRLRP